MIELLPRKPALDEEDPPVEEACGAGGESDGGAGLIDEQRLIARNEIDARQPQGEGRG